MNSTKLVAIVAHDAGGAEILASYVAQSRITGRFILAGPAVNVFRRRLGMIEIVSLKEGLSSCDAVLCGTSWQSDLEWTAIEQAQRAGIRVASFLDHWVNYPERFIRNGVQHLPDEVWVGDEYAEKMAAMHFPDIPVLLVPNPHFSDIKREISELMPKQAKIRSGGKILFVSENISDHARLRYADERYWGYTEFDAIEYLLQNRVALGVQIDGVVIRPHPSDAPGKYEAIKNLHAGFVRVGGDIPLLNEIVAADIVAGCQSMAMVVGLLAQKKVVSCIPPGGPECRLPQKQILQLRDQVLASNNDSAVQCLLPFG